MDSTLILSNLERRVRKLREKMAADKRLAGINLGNTGSPVFNRETEPKNSETDCMPEVELPGLGSGSENENDFDQFPDWKDPKNRAKIEKIADQRKERRKSRGLGG